MDWQPVETAPERVKALVYGRGPYFDCILMATFDGVFWWDYCGEIVHGITHWMPLPEPPK